MKKVWRINLSKSKRLKKTFKRSSAKRFFLHFVCYRCILLRSMFLSVIFPKSLSLLWDFFNRHIFIFFEISVLKEVRILRYLHNNSAVLILMLILSSKMKLSYTIFIHTWKTFIADVFYGNVFNLNSLFFDCSTLCFINKFFFEKHKQLL